MGKTPQCRGTAVEEHKQLMSQKEKKEKKKIIFYESM